MMGLTTWRAIAATMGAMSYHSCAEGFNSADAIPPTTHQEIALLQLAKQWQACV